MGLRLFLTSFATGVCVVLFGVVLASTVLSRETGAKPANGTANEPTRSSLPQTQQVRALVTETPESLPKSSPTPQTKSTLEPTNVPPQPQIVQSAQPGPPAGLNASYVAGEGVALIWNPVVGAAYYNIYRSIEPGGGPGATYTALGSNGSAAFRDINVQAGTTYYYVVTTSSEGFESASSNEASIQIPES